MEMSRKDKVLSIRLIVSAVLMGLSFFFRADMRPVYLSLLGMSYLVAGFDVIIKAFKGIIHLQPFDECFLMCVATFGAVALGEYTEAVAVMLFYQLGELFQRLAVGRSRRNISALLDIRPDRANLLHFDGSIEDIPAEDVPVGSIIVVRPGERVPIDGKLVAGSSSMNLSALTGESVPRYVMPGAEVLSGSINGTGLLKIKTTKEFGLSTASRILELVEEASSKKARSEEFISRFARLYTPAVCLLALTLAVLPPLFSVLSGLPGAWEEWIYRALTFLVISCPCALVLSIPLSFFAALGGAGNAGILIKGSGYIETLSKLRTVVMDKTGTLTKGSFELTEIYAKGMGKEELLSLVAHAEADSLHPVARGIVAGYGGEIDPRRVSALRELPGKGVCAELDGMELAAGNLALMRELGISCPLLSGSGEGTLTYVAIAGKYRGYIRVSDLVKPSSRTAVKALERAGIDRIVMLSGDAEEVCASVGAQLGIREVFGALLPGQKLEMLERILSQTEAGTLAFVGDGVNDAPVLARADVGIAMGALGSDAAIEAADVVLMDDEPMKIAVCIKHAQRCMAIVKQNIFFSISVKLICLVLGALGLAGIWAAVFADVGVMVLAVLNAMRAMRLKGWTGE